MTQIEWDKLPEKARWDIISALRGPDVVHSDNIKWFGTSVIRAKMITLTNTHGLVNNSLNLILVPSDHRLLSKEELKTYTDAKLPTDMLVDGNHFFNHLITAAQWLKIPLIPIEGKVYREAMREESRLKALHKVIEWAEEAKSTYLYNLFTPELKSHYLKLSGGYEFGKAPDYAF